MNRTHYESKPAATAGILQWFRLGDVEQVTQTLLDMKRLGIRELRTGVSWADYHTPKGQAWYDWLMPTLAAEVNVLPCFLYTPPSLGVAAKTSSPPRAPKQYADFLDLFIGRHGRHFDWVELWNEPNNVSEYDFTLDSNWEIFCDMVVYASYWAKELGKRTLLGGMSPVDPNWIELMAQRNALQFIDAVGIHGFPGTFEPETKDWGSPINAVGAVLERHGLSQEIWITEAGFSTWQHDERKQVLEFLKVMQSSASRVYWYSLYDLSPSLPTVDGFHLDEREYHFGLKKANGKPKLLYRLLQDHGVSELESRCRWLRTGSVKSLTPEYVLVTGGCGFVATNLAHHLLSQGHKVMLYDNLARPGVERNLEWLLQEHDWRDLRVEIADVRNYHALERAVASAHAIYHLAAQVAVTTSLDDPRDDFSVNASGTFNLLEAIRHSAQQPPLIFTSTNKVYGTLPQLSFKRGATRYFPDDAHVRKNGISERQHLEFHSPYGCSKGAAEQYVLDYARSYDLRTAVLRMSCIYGPHQFGTEDQGWVAHFAINCLNRMPITIFGDGLQVRDILFVDDLVDALTRALEHIDLIKGRSFNIGGGPGNSVSLLELLHMLETLSGHRAELRFEDPRIGDQLFYVTDTREFTEATGWRQQTGIRNGLRRLRDWLASESGLVRSKLQPGHEAIQRWS